MNIRTPQIAALALATIGLFANAQTAPTTIHVTPDAANSPYVIDSQRAIVRNATGLCWRTGFWTAEAAARTSVLESSKPAGCYCDPELMAKPVCETPVAALPAVTPVPPAPVVPVPPVAMSEKVTFPADALFAFDKAALSSDGKATLDALIGKIKGIELEAVIAVGHADRIGSEAYNLELSTQRAAAIKSYLADIGGVQPSRIFIEGRGETAPVTGAECSKLGAESGRNKQLVTCLAPDRRVVIEAVGSAKR